MAEYQYRLTVVTTADYGDSPAAGRRATGQLVRLPDGRPWDDAPQTLNIGVAIGTRPGGLYRVIIEEISHG